jgi:hypothetical protein
VREAAIVKQVAGGQSAAFVLAGRSLREVEDRESQLTQMVGLAWAVALVGSFVLWVAALALGSRLPRRSDS